MAQPFLLDSAAAGGLGLKTSTVGFIYGTCGAVSLLVGGVIGGFFITRCGAGRLLIPFSLLQSLSILAYYWLSITKPGSRLGLPGKCYRAAYLWFDHCLLQHCLTDGRQQKTSRSALCFY